MSPAKETIPTHVTNIWNCPYPKMLIFLGQKAEKLAPDTEKNLYGIHTKEETRIVYETGTNFFKQPPKSKESGDKESEELLSKLEENIAILDDIVGDEELTNKVLTEFRKTELKINSEGTPFSAYVSHPKEKEPSKKMPYVAFDELWLGDDLVKMFQRPTMYFHLELPFGSTTAKIQVEYYFLATPQEIDATNIATRGTLNLETGDIQITEKSLPDRYRDLK